jgi:hypothetical protein
VFQSKEIPRAQGNALLAALDGGRAVEDWKPMGKDYKGPFGCVLPPPLHHQISVVLTDGTNYFMSFSASGGLISVPEGYYEVTAQSKVLTVLNQLEEDLRREVVNAPKPCVYKIGTVEDGYTLSGVARLFYGDASKWPKIYEANRKVLKSPHSIQGGEKLTIPKL